MPGHGRLIDTLACGRGLWKGDSRGLIGGEKVLEAIVNSVQPDQYRVCFNQVGGIHVVGHKEAHRPVALAQI